MSMKLFVNIYSMTTKYNFMSIYTYTGVQKFLYTIEMIDFFNTKHLISRQQTNWSR